VGDNYQLRVDILSMGMADAASNWGLVKFQI
jgi:hypothetical protein